MSAAPAHNGDIDFCRSLKDLFNTLSTTVGYNAFKNEMTEILKLLLNTDAITFAPNADMKPHELKLDFIRLCFTVTVEHFVETYPRIQQLLLAEIDRIHYGHLADYCSMYRKDINTVTATELAREMIRGIDVSYHDTTGNKATHFGVAFLHLGMIRRGSNLEHVIKKDIQKNAAYYNANDLFKHLIANGRA
jgi:hypothetical protein